MPTTTDTNPEFLAHLESTQETNPEFLDEMEGQEINEDFLAHLDEMEQKPDHARLFVDNEITPVISEVQHTKTVPSNSLFMNDQKPLIQEGFVSENIPAPVNGQFAPAIEPNMTRVQDPILAEQQDAIFNAYTDGIPYVADEVRTPEFQKLPIEKRYYTAMHEFNKALVTPDYEELPDNMKLDIIAKYVANVVKPTGEEIRAFSEDETGMNEGAGFAKAMSKIVYGITGIEDFNVSQMFIENMFQEMDKTKSLDARDNEVIYERDRFGDSVLEPELKSKGLIEGLVRPELKGRNFLEQANDYITGANKGEIVGVEDGTVGRGAGAYVGEYSPEIAGAVGTAFIKSLGKSLMADAGLYTAIVTAKEARQDGGLQRIHDEVVMTAGINGLTYGVFRLLGAGKLNEASQHMHGKPLDEITPAQKKEMEDLQELVVAKVAEDTTPEELAKAEEILADPDKINQATQAPKADKPTTDYDPVAEVREGIYERAHADLQKELKEDQRILDIRKKRAKKGDLNERQQARMEESIQEAEQMLEDTKLKMTELDKKYGKGDFQVNANGGALGGAIGGGVFNEIAMAYEEMNEGEISAQEKNARRIGSVTGGALLGKKYGGSGKNETRMFVGAKETEQGAFSSIVDKGVRKWIDDTGSTVDPDAFSKSIKNAFETGDHHIKKAFEQFNEGKINKFDLDTKLYKYQDRLKNAKNRLYDKDADIKEIGKIQEKIDNIADMRQIFSEERTVKVKEILKHDELYKAEPELADMDVTVLPDNLMDGTKGYWDGKGFKIAKSMMDDPEELRSTLLHELQHGVQEKYNWNRGGNTKDLNPDDLIETIKLNTGDLPFYREQKAKLDAGDITKKEYYEKVINTGSNSFAGGFAEARFKTYRRLGGEQEARATQAKLKHPDLEPYQALKKEEGELAPAINKQEGGKATQEDAPAFYSKLEKVLDETDQKMWNPQQLRGYLKKQGVKEEEMRVTGGGKFLDDMEGKGKVTLDELKASLVHPQYSTKTYGSTSGNQSKYQNYSTKVEGGKNYREVVTKTNGQDLAKYEKDYDKLSDEIQSVTNELYMYRNRFDIEEQELKKAGASKEDFDDFYKRHNQAVVPLLERQTELKVARNKLDRPDLYESDHFRGDEGYLYHRRAQDVETYSGDSDPVEFDELTRQAFDELFEVRTTPRGDHVRKTQDVINLDTGETVYTFTSGRRDERLLDQAYRKMRDEGKFNDIVKKEFKGEKTLLSEESQSDLHQEGRKHGYKGENEEEMKALSKKLDILEEKESILRDKKLDIRREAMREGGYTPDEFDKAHIAHGNSMQRDVMEQRITRNYEKIELLKERPQVRKDLDKMEAKYPDIDFDDIVFEISGKIRKVNPEDADIFEDLIRKNSEANNITKSIGKMEEEIAHIKTVKTVMIKEKDTYNKLDKLNDELFDVQEEASQVRNKYYNQNDAVSKEPYYKTEDWTLKIIKDEIDEAVKGGYERVAWVSGQAQAERYNIANTVDYLKYRKNKSGKYDVSIFTKEHGHYKTLEEVEPKEIADTLGKAVADEIVTKAETPPEDYWHNMYNQDIPIGGEGMKGYYDKMRVKTANKYIKQFGSKVDVRKLRNGQEVWSFKVTDDMKTKIKTEGQPLYTNPATTGALFGFEQNEDGTYSYDILKGALGATGMAIAGKKLTEEKMKAMLKKVGIKPKKYTEADIDYNVTAKAYSDAIKNGKRLLGSKGILVDNVSPEEAQKILDEGGDIFMTKDGYAGAYLKPDGYMGGLFKSPLSQKDYASTLLQMMRTDRGGKYFDSYAWNEPLYVKNGFRPVGRMKFNEEFAPKGWEKSPELKDKPDVVVFVHDPEHVGKVGEGKYFDNYEEFLEYGKNFKTGKMAKEAEAEEKLGQATQEFFSAVVNGQSDKFNPSKAYEYIKNFKGKAEQSFQKTIDRFRGNFDEHIATSIPTFRDIQIAKGTAIVKTYPEGARMIDIGGSEGGFVKAITHESNGGIETVNLDVNLDMKNAFDKSGEIHGSTFEHGAFQQGWDDIPTYVPKEKFDVVHESMVFQFINKERKSKLDEIVDKYITDDGLLITEQKFKLDDAKIYKANENLKDTRHKNQYYTDAQLKMKSDSVLVGMDKDQANFREYMSELKKRFKYVDTYWTSGNFRGIVASNSREKFDKFLSNVDTIKETKRFTKSGEMRAGFTKGEALAPVISSGIGAIAGARTADDKEQGAITGAVFGALIGLGSVKANSKWIKKERVAEGILPPETKLGRVQRALQDKFNRVRELMKVKAGDRVVPDSMNPVQAEVLYHGRAEDRMDRFKKEVVTPLIKKITSSQYSMDDLDLYLHARHARERNARNLEMHGTVDGSGMSDERAEAILAEFDTPEMQGLAQYVDNMNEARLRLIEQDGLESPEMVDMLRTGYENYVPLMRDMSDKDIIQGVRSGKGFSNKSKEFKRSRGSDRTVLSPTVMSMINYQSTLVHGEKNNVGKALLKFIKEYPDDSLYTVESVKHMPQYDQYGEVVGMNPKYQLADNVMHVKVDGKVKEITLKDKALADAFKNLNATAMGGIAQLAHKGVRFLASMSTSYNPEFVISNFMRDIQTAMANMPHLSVMNEAKMIRDVAPAVKGIFTEKGEWGKWYKEFSANGGKTGWIDMMQVDTEVAKLEKEIAMLEGRAPVRKTFTAILDSVDHINTAVENGIRLVAYRQMREAGATARQSAEIAKELTVNFNKKGELGTAFNTLYMFANASAQGSVRMFRALAKTKKAQAGATALIGVGASLHMYNKSKNEKEYDKIPRYIKDTNLIMMKEDGNYIKIPLPYGYNVFKSMGDMVGEKITNGEVQDGLVNRLTSTAGNAFNPIGTSDNLAHTLTPTLLKPVYEISENVNFFGGNLRPEEKQYEPDDLPESQKKFKSVTKSSSVIAEKLNSWTDGTGKEKGWIDVSPENIDYIVKFVGGGLGTLVQNTEITAESLLDDEKKLDWNKVPFARRVYGTPKDKANSWSARDILEKSGNTKISDYQTKKFNEYMRDGLKDKSISPKHFKQNMRQFKLNQLEVDMYRDMKISGKPTADQLIEIEVAKYRYKVKYAKDLLYSDSSLKSMRTGLKKKIKDIKTKEK